MSNINNHSHIQCDYLIVGAGIIGLTIAKTIHERSPSSIIYIIEKEDDVAQHSSGRNSGVIHAGFYYTQDSLKAKFTKDGNTLMKEYCSLHNIPINSSGKVVIAQNEQELDALYTLHKRAQANGVNTSLISTEELSKIEPNAKTFKQALYSPDTATVDPKAVCSNLKQELSKKGIHFSFQDKYLYTAEKQVHTSKHTYSSKFFINCAGLYADVIAHEYNYGNKYTILPFKGIYLKYSSNDKPISTNIYPVPNLKNPFLGVHYTLTVDNHIKIGPTAIPTFWRENYAGFKNFNFQELCSILKHGIKLLWTNAFNFRDLAFTEVSKYIKSNLINLAKNMVFAIDAQKFNDWSTPGIRAQLLDIQKQELVQDFIVEGDQDSLHVLNAVSPAFTASFAFSKWIVERYVPIL